ncbi:MAG: DUF6290 family protein [Lachnospiraceae bacterium]|nr:DUF6290 family protein [Lachnospiraceae bacterium]
MSTLSVRLPNSVHDAVKDYASDDNISINQFIASAVMEKITALDTEKYLKEKASKGSKEKFKAVLGKVPDTEPDESDKFNS